MSEQVSSMLVQKERIRRPIPEFYAFTTARRMKLFRAVSKGKVRIPVLQSNALNAPI